MRRLIGAALVAVQLVLFVLAFVAAVTGHAGLGFGALLALFAGEVALLTVNEPWLTQLLATASAGPSWRVFLREVLLVVLLLRTGALSHVGMAVVVGAVLVHHGLFGAQGALAGSIRGRRLRRLETRNLPVPGDELPRQSPEWAMTWGGRILLQADVLPIAALGLAVAGGSYSVLPAAAIGTVVVSALIATLLLPEALALHRLPGDERRLHAAQRAVLELEPLVILYFTGGRDSAYQVNTWFETMERLERPVLVLLRERRYLDQIAATTLPVLCLPFSVDMMNFRMPTARVALFVANAGRNIHLLREPGIKSAFIGHGDSDKIASFNPFTKAYDEVWVAGRGGRDRYARADVGVRDDEIVYVGRPQLDGIHDVRPRPDDSEFTVLYAPTWEGWTEDLNQCSVPGMGVDMIRTLLGTPGVRVVYKPHPFTGKVDPQVGAANAAVIDLIATAGAPHVAVLDTTRTLYDWFNEADALIGDVSSVVSDFVRSGKPYFVTNPAGDPDEVFRDQNPSAGAAYLVGPRAVGLAPGIEAARGADPRREQRREIRTYLLGDPSLDSMTLFRAAVDSLAAKARGQAEIPNVDADDDLLATSDLGQDPEAAVARAGGEDRG